MKGTYTSLNNLRRQVFEEVARLAYEQAPYEAFNDVPYHIISGEYGTYRDSVFLERAVVRQRIRLAVGLSPHRANENQPVSKGVEAADRPECYYEPPLINVIKFACNACPDNVIPARRARSGSMTTNRISIRASASSAAGVSGSVRTARSSGRKDRAERPAGSMRSALMSMDWQILTMISVCPAGCVW